MSTSEEVEIESIEAQELYVFYITLTSGTKFCSSIQNT